MDVTSDFVTGIWTEIRLGTGIRFHPSRPFFNQSQDYPTLSVEMRPTRLHPTIFDDAEQTC